MYINSHDGIEADVLCDYLLTVEGHVGDKVSPLCNLQASYWYFTENIGSENLVYMSINNVSNKTKIKLIMMHLLGMDNDVIQLLWLTTACSETNLDV